MNIKTQDVIGMTCCLAMLLAYALVSTAHCAPLPTVDVQPDGTANVVIPAIDINGDRSQAVLVLKADGKYTYELQSWGCNRTQFSPLRVEWLEACELK